MPRTYSHLSYEQRLRIKELLDKGTKKVDIARVLGIICLNDPTKDLIEKVKADDQMRLFEYSISYSEII